MVPDIKKSFEAYEWKKFIFFETLIFIALPSYM